MKISRDKIETITGAGEKAEKIWARLTYEKIRDYLII
jgi:hypothetical protein